MEAHREVDIALDSYPYHGTTTTCSSLWMGVPGRVAGRARPTSRAWATRCWRASACRELAPDTPDGYVAAACGLAGDLDALAALRAGLRERMASSPLTDGPGCARALDRAYREMWRTWCCAAPEELVAARPRQPAPRAGCTSAAAPTIGPGWMNIDRQKLPGVDVVADLDACARRRLALRRRFGRRIPRQSHTRAPARSAFSHAGAASHRAAGRGGGVRVCRTARATTRTRPDGSRTATKRLSLPALVLLLLAARIHARRLRLPGQTGT